MPPLAAPPPARPDASLDARPALSLAHAVRPATGGHAAGDAGRPPLVVLLHGVGANERQMAALAPALDPRCVVVSARSPLVLGPDAYAWFHVAFTGAGPVIDAGEAAAGWAHVARFAGEAAAAYGADPARVYVAGFSQGAIVALAALLTAPDRIAGAAALSGRLLPEVLPHVAPAPALAGRPVLVAHGAADAKLGVAYARAARDVLARLPVALTYRELDAGHAITPEGVAALAAWLTAALDAPSPDAPHA